MPQTEFFLSLLFGSLEICSRYSWLRRATATCNAPCRTKTESQRGEIETIDDYECGEFSDQ